MPVLPLRLRTAAQPTPVCAGWLPVAEVAAWLAEAGRIAQAAPRAEVCFYPMARPAQDQTASGVLIRVTGEVPNLDRVLGPQVQRLGEIFPGVLAPVLSTLEPSLSAAERQRCFPWNLQFIHPVLGLTGFEERDALSPWQLLAPLSCQPGDWLAAVPGPDPRLPLRQLTLVQEMSFEELMAADGGDISSLSTDAADPKSAGLLEKAGGMAAGLLGAMGAGLMGAMGQGKAAAALDQWSRRQLDHLNNRRQKELNQLLDRFDKDTLDALRHAIPLAGAESRRGNAQAPAWKLGMRNPDLNPFSQGSGAVDVWNITADTRLKLEKRYREAAAREAAAGQFGRAAYIYGELLGDWAKAAAMLEKAGRPREAARIYRERLRSGSRAAQCMEQAGLLAEAAALYQEAGQWEKAGDLMAALGQPEAAREHWETALTHLTNPLEQARLLETKLQDPDRALLVLKKVFVKSSQARACFEAGFALLGRLGRHECAAAWLDKLEQQPTHRLEPASAMAAGLHSVYSTYPDFAIRDQAAALAPHLIGLALTDQPSRSESTQLLKLLPQFSPGDRLLARDASRFSLAKHKPAVPLLASSNATALRPEQVIQLRTQISEDIFWQSITSSPQGFHAAGFMRPPGGSAVLMTTDALEDLRPDSRLKWEHNDPRLNHLVSADGHYCWIIHSRALQHAVILLPHPDGVPQFCPDVLAAGHATDDEFVMLCLAKTGTLILNYCGSDGAFRRTRVLDFAPPGLANGDWFIGGHGPELWIAGMDVVCCVTAKTDFQHTAIRGPITAFALAPPVLSSQSIAVGASEAVLLIPHGKGKPLECVNLFAGTASKPPVTAFTADGRAIIADGNGGVAYQVRGSIRKQADIVIPPESGELIAATATGARGFAFLTSTGKVLVYA